jgi:hypothetical protein
MALTTGETLRSGVVGDADGRGVTIDAGGISDTATSSASVAAPGLGAIAGTTVAGVVGGIYRIRAVVALTGTAETQLVNVQLRTSAFHSAIPALTGQVVVMEWPRVTLTGNPFLYAAAAATGGSIYTCSLSITRVE